MGSLFPSLALPLELILNREAEMIYNVLCTIGLMLCSLILEGVKGCSISVVCLCRKEEAMLLPALQSDFKCCSEAAETEMVVAGDCAWLGHLQHMCSSAPQPKDIPFVFHALAVSLVCGQLSGQWAVILGKWPLEREAKSG